MTKVFGRKRRMSIFAVTGNGNGLAGFALSKAMTVQDAIRKVKNRAGQKLLHIQRYNDHTGKARQAEIGVIWEGRRESIVSEREKERE